ncbi:unnamed protein product [Arabidopsis arenosa]|uniref:SWIM-type domain-containing protein n=1 Tax=Arabidopsis arenosa TaxID=38785 RepID=A0A8S2ASM8_ARAAE|nr:unnamed protein product [Arabidopsis arenosa]
MEVDDIVVVQAGRWILYSTGEWEFKMDSYRQGRALSLMGLKTFRDLELKVRQLYRMERSSISTELSYMFEDNLALLAGVQPGPTMIRCDRQFRSFKSLSIHDKSVNLFVCFREGDGVKVGPTPEARRIGSCFAKGLELGDSSAGIVEAVGNSRATEEVGYFSGLLSAVQDNNTVYPPVQGNNSQLAIAQSSDVIDSSGGWDISDEILLAAVEAVEKSSKTDLVAFTGLTTSVAVEDGMESSGDEECSENSDDSYTYSGGSESEDDDYDYENNTVGRLEAGREIVGDEDSGDDDFVEQPPKKKVRQKEKGKGIEERTDNLACVGGVMTEFLHTIQKGISIDEVYGYEDIEPMFGDDDMDRKAAHVDLSKEDDNMKKISRTVGDIPIAVERELLKRFKGGLGMTVLAVGRWDFEVVAKDGEQFLVSLEQQTCSCLEFQKIRIPCVHAMAAAHDRNLEFRTLVGEMHRLEMWSPTVQESILPVRDPSEVDVPEEIRVLCLMPPKTKRPPGRPPKLRIHSVGEYEGNNKSKQPNKCGRCGGVGHNRVTCTNPLG